MSSIRTSMLNSSRTSSEWECQVRFRFAINAQVVCARERKNCGMSYSIDSCARHSSVDDGKFRPIKDIFTRNKIICCGTLKGMKWNKCDIYVFPFIYWFAVLSWSCYSSLSAQTSLIFIETFHVVSGDKNRNKGGFGKVTVNKRTFTFSLLLVWMLSSGMTGNDVNLKELWGSVAYDTL